MPESLKDMPKKTGDYLMLTNMGYILTFRWNTHDRSAKVYSFRTDYNPILQERVDAGKVDMMRLNFKHDGFGFAWCEIPEYDGPMYSYDDDMTV